MPLRNIGMTRIWREWSGTLPAAKVAENFSCHLLLANSFANLISYSAACCKNALFL